MNTATATPAFTETDARKSRQEYQKFTHIIDRILNRIVQSLDEDTAKSCFKPSVFQTVHSLHGLLNGRDLSKQPLYLSHQFAVIHFNFHGDVTSTKATNFMCRRLEGLRAAEIACGRAFFTITRADNKTQLLTGYEATPLLDATQWVYKQARNDPDYWKNPGKAITDELIAGAVERLPKVVKPAEPPTTGANNENGEKSEGSKSGDLMTESVMRAARTNLLEKIGQYLINEFDAGKDATIQAEILARKIKSLGVQIQTKLTRERLRNAQNPVDADWESSNVAPAEPQAASADWNDFEEIYCPPDVDPVEHPELVERRHFDERQGETGNEDTYVDDIGKNNVPQWTGGSPETEPPTLNKEDDIYCHTPLKNEGGTKGDIVDSTGFNESPNVAMIDAALDWALQGVPVFPLHTPNAPGVCSCKDGAECGNTGKHPRTFNGLKDATTDEKIIRNWFRQYPETNCGGVMGDAAGIIAVDIDPKNAGDLSLTDLIEVYGDEWTQTKTVRTGSGGFHFYFKHPKGLNLRNTAGKIAPGIDTRANGGYVVLAPSLHASGKRYELINDCEPLPLPEWLLERLTADRTKHVDRVIDFQVNRERRASRSGGGIIPDGERNQKLFKIASAIWGKGEASHLLDLHAQLDEINLQRCSPPLEGAEIARIAASVARYPRGVPIDPAARYERSRGAV